MAFVLIALQHVILSPPPSRGRLGWGVIEERDDEKTFYRGNMACIELVATPHPSLPLKGGGEESEPAMTEATEEGLRR
jgi:hypothetical protein